MTRFLALLVIALGTLGCGRPGQGDLTMYIASDPELAMSGVNMDDQTWESAPWSAEGVMWIPFRPHEQVQVEHALGFAPTVVLTYIAFTASGATPSLAAGDLTRVVEVTDTTVTVWNDTNGSYFVRIVAF